LFTAPMGSGSSPLSCGVFLPPPLSQAFPLLVAGCMPGSHWSLSSLPGLFFTVPGRIPFPQSSAHSAPHPLSCVSLLFLLLITQFLFFPRVKVGLSRRLCWSDLELSVGVSRTTKLTLSASYQTVWVQATGGLGALLISLLTWIGDALCRLEVWRGQSFVSSWWFCLQGVSPVFLQDFTIGGTLSASSL
jgi:hypothetical protein